MEALWAPYRDGKIRVSLEVVDRQPMPQLEQLEAIFGSRPKAQLYGQRLACLGAQQ